MCRCRMLVAVEDRPGGLIRDSDLSPGYDRPGGISYCALNTSCATVVCANRTKNSIPGKRPQITSNVREATREELSFNILRPSFWGRSLQNFSLTTACRSFSGSPLTRKLCKSSIRMLRDVFSIHRRSQKPYKNSCYKMGLLRCLVGLKQFSRQLTVFWVFNQKFLIFQLVTPTCCRREGDRSAIATAENPKNRIFNL